MTQIHSFLANEGIETTLSFDTRRNKQVLETNVETIKGLFLNHEERMIYEPIRRIWKSKIEVPVYDLEMPETHVYVANNLYAHNSYFMYELLAQAQKLYEPTIGLVVDREGAYSQKRGEQIGIDNSKLIVTKPYDTPLPHNAVNFIEKSVELIHKENPEAHIVIILDSMAAFDKDVDRDKQDMGKGAMSWHNAFRDLLTIIDENVVFLYSNHVTYKPIAFGNPKTKAGGEAANYYRSCGVALDRRGHIVDEKKGSEVVGDRLQVIVDKTRQGPALRKLILPYYYTTGVTELAGYLWMLALRGYITPKNKEDFKSGKAQTFIYEKEGKSYTFHEGQEELVLKNFPELNFEVYPDFKEEGVKNETP
jgi:RecA/RadA recombinase